jgi:hypothetical protein
MKLQLHINGSLFDCLDVDESELLGLNYEFNYRVEKNEERVQAYIAQLKAIFFKQICKSESFEIFMVIDSRMIG